MRTLFQELQARGFIYQVSDPEIEKKLNEWKISLYHGADPTGDSLHVGHLVPQLMMSHFRRAGHNPILLIGGATGMIGDPSFKDTERPLLTIEQIAHNVECLRKQVASIQQVDPSKVTIVNNYDWFSKMDCLTFLREIGKYFTVNAMLAKDSVKSRIDREGEWMSFTEFSYSLLQGHDFYHLFETMNCTLQVGGSDQWGNMVAGTELIRRKKWESAYVITCPLITRADGTKFWKTASGFMVWLDPEKTSPYAFYQFWINTDDESAAKYIKIYTFIELEEIDRLIEEHRKAPEKRLLQKTLAFEVTKLIHGEETTKRVMDATSILFGEKISEFSSEMIDLLSKEMPTVEMSKSDLETLSAADILTNSGLTKSKSEARTLIDGKWISVNNAPIADFDWKNISGKAVLLRKGKKDYRLVVVK